MDNNENNALSKKILVVEDDPFLSNLLKIRLEKERLNVILAKDGDEAIKKFKKQINYKKMTKWRLSF
jgi:DNA-binding response OmpR family regulator